MTIKIQDEAELMLRLLLDCKEYMLNVPLKHVKDMPSPELIGQIERLETTYPKEK